MPITKMNRLYRIKGGGGSIIFKRQILPQQAIYRWKRNLMAIRIHLTDWKNILISRLYEQFLRDDTEMATEWLFEKFQIFKNEHIIYHFKARDLEILLI